jgi:hypothetical protein
MRKNFFLTLYCAAVTVGASLAATHSAWSSPIPWDSGVGIEGTSLNGPATALGFAIQPNPASVSHAVRFQIQGTLDARAELKIVDVNGKLVQSLPLAGLRSGGAVTWNPSGKNGKSLASGVYLARLKSGTASIEQKFMLLK